MNTDNPVAGNVTAVQVPYAPPRRRTVFQEIWRNRVLYLLLLPTFAGAILFQYYPAVNAFYRSFYAWDGRRAVFVGLNNFKYFFEDPKLLKAWGNVAQLLTFHILVVVTVPVIVAYLIFRLANESHRYLFRVLFVLPMVIPGFVTILLWRWFYSSRGAINFLLRIVGMESLTRAWLGDPKTALYALMFMGFPWVGGVTMLIYLAGFMAISPEILDAAVVDGATGLRRFWQVELPLIQGQIKLQVVLAFIGIIQSFQTQMIMTNGGPGWATMVPGLSLYQAGMIDFELGYASAIGVVLFIVIFVLTLINQRYISGGQQYGEG